MRPVPPDCTAQNVDWKAFLNGRRDRPFDGFRLINWRLFWEFSGGNCAENMVHQIAWIMSALDLPLPSAAYMSGGVFSEKDGREVPDTIAVTLDFPDTVVTWQSMFSNRHYELGDRILGSDGTIEHHLEESIQYWPEKTNRPTGEVMKGKTPNQNHMQNWIDCVRSRGVAQCFGGDRIPFRDRRSHGEPVVQEETANYTGRSKSVRTGILGFSDQLHSFVKLRRSMYLPR